MKKALLLIAFAICTNIAYSQPSTISYQGVLTNEAGALINGNRALIFKVYDASAAGNLLATDNTHAAVPITNGLFNVELSLGAINYAQDLWLEIEVAGTVLSPRVKFNANGYSSVAGKATSVQITTNAGAGKVLTSDASGNGSWAAPAGITNFTESRNTTAPNDTKPAHVLAATGTGTDLDIVISPKGNGALIADLPDGAATGGNKRGTFAVDLQMYRTANTQVASGNISTISGGQGNTASNYLSTVGGGFHNTASNNVSTVGGGGYNHASGTYSTVGGGYTNTASGYASTVGGGSNNTASGGFSFAVGNRNTAQSYGETVLGIYATVGAGTAISQVATDRLFVVGNGTNDGAGRSNALTILKNGNTTISGSLSANSLSLSYSAQAGATDLTNVTDAIISVNNSQTITNLPTGSDGKIIYIINSGAGGQVALPNSLGNITAGKVATLVAIGTTWYRVN